MASSLAARRCCVRAPAPETAFSFRDRSAPATPHGSRATPGFYRVEARLGLGVALRDAASAAIDISDGLLADLGHVCAASGVAAEIDLASLPLADGVDAHTALSCGDDYELLFTAKDVSALEVPVYAIGKIVPGTGVTVLEGGQALPRDTSPTSGFRHFQ